MFGQRGRRWARIALATVAGGALALGSALPAAATPATGVAKTAGASAKLMLNGKVGQQSALALEIDGKLVPAFCIDYHTKVALNEKYQEGTWGESQVKNLGKVQWVLTHGYPNADSAKLLAAAGATAPAQADVDNLLYFGTQTAVWHFSDEVKLGDWVEGKDLLAKDKYDVVKKVRDYLVANATDQPEPKADLSVDPASAKATVGEKAGPFTVKGPAGEITVAASGGSAVDAEGKPVTTTTNGGQFWLTADGAGEVKVTVSAQGSVSFGRVFLFTGERAAQKLILGGSAGETVTAKAGAAFAAAPTESPTPSAPAESPSPSAPAESPSPTAPVDSPAPSTSPASSGGDLPLTGSPIAAAIAGGVALLAAGAVAVLVFRRRKLRFTA
ncbi:Cys-Gln thioester bond-forming surface protein [Micromonospora peucetia]|uniref:Cys-Gln thioester bond-forming surface protein n=1 Tax=Micromonospora peucetia TaxID=47871 RepID=A0A1C6VB63_9ACTN|nr:Cys-Gln thioester bond-forming surface protein [Micromonospora peucetia]MCX4389527.1 Cys-Gln thioester bond-forming surface protein [Micromonospora peucetia]WSA30013.1 Cys-Gln thioester bond-forming surface protein [Micromonospora peucetia]SCL63566.1 LPXTG-motif cell wall anchor domain-containing protein/TQXA domain-containing protein [Micromonospora peucetia]